MLAPWASVLDSGLLCVRRADGVSGVSLRAPCALFSLVRLFRVVCPVPIAVLVSVFFTVLSLGLLRCFSRGSAPEFFVVFPLLPFLFTWTIWITLARGNLLLVCFVLFVCSASGVGSFLRALRVPCRRPDDCCSA
jgi:hypothetical protein